MKILLKCKTCNKVLGEFEVKGQLDFDFTCARCKQKNIGVIKEHNREKVKFMTKTEHVNKHKLC